MADEPTSGEPTAPVDSAVGLMVANEGTAQDTISDNLVTAILLLWAGFSAYYAGDAVADLGARLARLVVMAQQASGRVTEAHLRQQLRRMGYNLPTRTIVDLPTDLRLGAATPDVYQRPVRNLRYLESTGMAQDEAALQARERLVKQALTDLQLARNTASQQVHYALPDETPIGKVRGYRRVIHPELGHVCGLCIAAADRIYHKRELLALHPACKCTQITVIGENDPGGQLNAEDLARIYAAAGGTTESRALSKVRFEIKANGELGAVLTPEQVTMKGPAQVKRQLSDRAAAMRKEQLQKQIDSLQDRAKTSAWHRDRVGQLQELLDAA